MSNDSNSHGTDKLFRDRLYNAEVPPPPEVWNNVEQQLQNRRRRRVLFLLFALGLGLSGTMGYFNGWFNTAKPIIQTDAAPVVADAATTPKPLVEVPAPVTTTNESSLMVLRNNNTIAKKSIVEITERSLTSKSVIVQKPTQPDVTVQTVVPINNIILPVDVSTPVLIAPVSGVEAEKPVDKTNLKRLDVFEAISGRTLPLLSKEQVMADVNPTGKHKKHKDHYHFDHKNVFWLVDMYTGINGVNKQLSVADPANTNYMNKRKETERYDWAFSGGVQATVLLNQHFRISTGLHYDQIIEIFEFTDPNAVDYIVTERSNPDTIGKITGTRYIKSFNRFGMLEVPVTVGYEWRKARWGFNINAGASTNVLFGNSGRMMADAGRKVMRFSTFEDTGAPSTFNVNTGFSLMGNAQVFYHVRPQWRVFVAPYVRQQLQSITTTAHQIQQRHTIGGLQVGMTRILN